MTGLEILGAVGAASIRDRIKALTDGEGTARFMLDQLTGEQVAAIVKAVLSDKDTSAKIAIRIPRTLVRDLGVPSDVLTDERTVRLRHAEWDVPALLLANTDDDQGASLQDVTLLGAKQLTEEPQLWVQAASVDLGLQDDNKSVWEAALRGLAASDDWTLHQVSNFVELTRRAIAEESKPILVALGWALPALHLPRHSEYFLAGKQRGLTSTARWKKSFDKLIGDRRPLLVKQRPPRQVIESEELKSQFENVRDEIPVEAHAAIEEFIKSPPSWGNPSAALAEFEWEVQNILLLFSGLKQRKVNLFQETLEFFEFEMPDRLSEAEKTYLNDPTGRKEPRDDDREFFEAHREEVGRDRSLRAKWERFVFGRPIECTDFLEGLLRALERLYGQAGTLQPNRTLEIRTGKRTKNQWLELNADVATSFAVRYRGLPTLMGDKVKWDTSHLFEYQALLAAASKRKSYKPNVSTSRTSLQIKFDISLKIGADRPTVQLIWVGRPNEIGIELRDDLERLSRRALVRSSVARQPVSRKGGLQAVSLNDISSLQPAFRQDSGSLIPRLDGGEDVGKSYPKALKAAASAGRLSPENLSAIETAWAAFSDTYSSAISGFRSEGLASGWLLVQSERYGDLLRALAQHATGDLNRRELWEPVLALGCVPVTGGAPSAIIAPWHPLRLAALAVKARNVAGLTAHLLNADDVIFGDQRLFFADLREELTHPYYPEVAVAYQGAEPVLVTETSSLHGYSLMERPVRDPSEASTDVDPSEAAREIRALLERYLDLQPHERSNLSIMLYNCDAAGLPLATVNALGSVHDEDEMHCNVLVRHRDRKKLSRVYGELLERPESDPDTLVVSETSRNFMSKLRIGVMLDGGGASAEKHSVDVAFLHDVVSRQAKQEWFSVPAQEAAPDILDHVPARWSYRRVTAEDELKATSYLVCPRQPAVGWAYLDAVAAVVRQRGSSPSEHMLPAREISFQEQNLRAMFDEVHDLSEWVATYDDLLDKRQLMAQGISVIRYKRQRTHGRNIIVSSTSELRLLQVLVKRRLSELSLGLPEEELSALAERMINDARSISGDIVLRAARRGVSAGELIGLVLSRALVAEELGAQASVAWFLLDDYAEWLGQREQGIADILALSVGTGADGLANLRVAITEAKYVSAEANAEARRTSKQQLRQTVQRMEDALFGDPGRLDRDLWLSRISDLLLDGTTALGQSLALEAVRDGIRRGVIPIDLRGYSHVFIHGPADATVPGEQELIPDVPNGIQEIFGREELRNLIKAYQAKTSLSAARQALGPEQPWTKSQFREPALRVNWTNKLIAPTATIAAAPSGEAASPSEEKSATGVQPGPQTPTPSTPDVGPLTTTDAVGTPSAPGAPEEIAVAPVLPLDFLSLVESRAKEGASSSKAEQAWLDETAQKLRTALLGYGFQAKIAGARLTPNAALIRFIGSDRLRMEDIRSRESALLTTHGLRLVAISPLPGEIVVAVARPKRQTVSLWDVWSRRELNRNAAGQNTSFVLGLRELDGEILYLNLGSAFGGAQSHDPHTLVAGATGSGKSVLIQAMILDIAATNPSTLAQVILIDPKMGVDYSAIERLPHVVGGIVIDQARAQMELERLVAEMDRRYELFRSNGVRDLRSFNAAKPSSERLPLLFLIHDEFAEWMLTENYKDAVATTVQRLGVKARAAGIHLIFAAQRPDANVMPIQLRDNLGNRLILKVASVGTSEIALGEKGAESLLGLGHLAARLSGEAGIVFAQAPFLSDADIEQAVEAISLDDKKITGAAAE
ncbi:DNA segregation ATPase FtsK/SpoIIIE, S-DNA-T family [Bradyrhizobium brasilense]|uniref:DNA segregation ATPase FtsK/SpoIIIE, S-DNA-T family n=1 Tax=Bradyrhizobium brasilense TaxID=1419277 RepID=A0A1G6RUU9_9BRAD|nr:FtsK/SpoIIIE domain-containing protein [Bradyrhizobium brasilense]SDD08328.1 DNA segregation ATPase FtsK/SpoIIIE, S-DNA-T family [Bradyrhizobium brasilense]